MQTLHFLTIILFILTIIVILTYKIYKFIKKINKLYNYFIILENDKKFPAFASDKISALDDISIYTYQKDVPLTEVYLLICEKENFKPSISHKEEPKKLREYLVTFLPDYDAERVYDTDVKKLFQWYI